MNFFRKYKNYIILSIVAFFLFSILVGFGTPMLSGHSPTDTAVEVSGEGMSTHKIPVSVYAQRRDRAMAQLPPGVAIDATLENQKRDEVIRDLVQGVVFEEQAKRFGIEVPDQQVANSLAQVPAFQENGAFSPQAYVRALQYQLKTTPQEFEEEQRRAIANFKLNWLIRSSIKLTDREYQDLKAQQGAEVAKELQGKSKERLTPAQLEAQMREQLWQQKVVTCFNQWFQQLGEKIKVKPHLDALKGVS